MAVVAKLKFREEEKEKKAALKKKAEPPKKKTKTKQAAEKTTETEGPFGPPKKERGGESGERRSLNRN